MLQVLFTFMKDNELHVFRLDVVRDLLKGATLRGSDRNSEYETKVSHLLISWLRKDGRYCCGFSDLKLQYNLYL